MVEEVGEVGGEFEVEMGKMIFLMMIRLFEHFDYFD
jgi:hypothetical protein